MYPRIGQQQPHIPATMEDILAAAVAAQQEKQQQKSRNEKAVKRKEKFLMFTHVLMKYLESKDKQMHAKAKAAIKHCAERKKAGDPQYTSFTTSMENHLRSTVSKYCWKRAEDYYKYFLQRDQKGGKALQSGIIPAPSATSTAHLALMDVLNKQKAQEDKQKKCKAQKNERKETFNLNRHKILAEAKELQQQQVTRRSKSSPKLSARRPNTVTLPSSYAERPKKKQKIRNAAVQNGKLFAMKAMRSRMERDALLVEIETLSAKLSELEEYKERAEKEKKEALAQVDSSIDERGKDKDKLCTSRLDARPAEVCSTEIMDGKKQVALDKFTGARTDSIAHHPFMQFMNTNDHSSHFDKDLQKLLDF